MNNLSDGTPAAVRELLDELNIFLPSYRPGHQRVPCPKCEGGGSGERSLAVNISPDGAFAMWNCLRANCGYSGHTEGEKISLSSSQSDTSTEENLQLMPLSEEMILLFSSREISKETLLRNGVMQATSYKGLAMAFPYWKDGKKINCKYRTLKKQFWQEKEALKTFYGLDDIKSANEIIIVEGEIDKLSMEEVGLLNCVSVPDGAPAKVSTKGPVVESEDKKYKYIYNCKDYLEKATRIILATDADVPGQALAEELARRLGRERCWRVKWPTLGGKMCKDANEVLQKLGKEQLRAVVENAEPYPITGLFEFSAFNIELDDYFHLRVENALGVSTGWHGVDAVYRVVPGELTLVTGVPNSGKSEWIDALMCNLIQLQGWTFGLCSMENQVREHARKLLEKYFKKPFFNALYANSVPRITPEELKAGKRWLSDNFYLIRCENDHVPSVDWVLKLAKAAVMRHGIRGLVIDPYNELDHHRPSNQTETEYVSQMLTKIKRFAQHHECHVWFVAHPRQLQGWQGDEPDIYDVSGSAHFINKCDNGVIIHRNRDPRKGPLDQVKVKLVKVRNKAAGTLGEAFLTYDRVSGQYKDYQEQF